MPHTRCADIFQGMGPPLPKGSPRNGGVTLARAHLPPSLTLCLWLGKIRGCLSTVVPASLQGSVAGDT